MTESKNSPESNSTLATRVKTLRTLYGLTQEEMGRIIDRSAMAISRVESGRGSLQPSQIANICSKLGVNELWLRDGSGPMTENEDSRDRRSIGERVYQVRRERKLSQTQFAALLGVSRNTVSLLERRKISASSNLIRSVVEKMGVDEKWLRSGDGHHELLDQLQDAATRRAVIAYLRQRYPEELT